MVWSGLVLAFGALAIATPIAKVELTEGATVDVGAPVATENLAVDVKRQIVEVGSETVNLTKDKADKRDEIVTVDASVDTDALEVKRAPQAKKNITQELITGLEKLGVKEAAIVKLFDSLKAEENATVVEADLKKFLHVEEKAIAKLFGDLGINEHKNITLHHKRAVQSENLVQELISGLQELGMKESALLEFLDNLEAKANTTVLATDLEKLGVKASAVADLFGKLGIKSNSTVELHTKRSDDDVVETANLDLEDVDAEENAEVDV